MIGWLTKRRTGPLGLDLGARSIKLVQFSLDQTKLLQSGRWDLPTTALQLDPAARQEVLRTVLQKAVDERGLKGSEVVVCLNDRQVVLQNVRVPRNSEDLDRVVAQEIAGRIPFNVEEAEIRYVESADVRQGETMVREVIVFVCHRPVLNAALELVASTGLRPVALDVEPAALARSYAGQFRREADKTERSLVVHVGFTRSIAVIAQGEDLHFVKYIDVGGSHFDQAIARQLKMGLPESAQLRRHHADRRSDLQDPEVARGVSEAIRPIMDKLAGELAMCLRYHSVTFRGQPLARLVVGGGEATAAMVETLGSFLNLSAELSDPFRHIETPLKSNRRGQWEIAAGLALQNLE